MHLVMFAIAGKVAKWRTGSASEAQLYIL